MREPLAGSTTPALTFAVCSNRTEYVRMRWKDNLSSLGMSDRLIIVVDLPHDANVAELAAELDRPQVEVIIIGTNCGLSHCRNVVMDLVAPAPVVFLDDDVRISPDAVRHIRDAFHSGAFVVGARLGPPAYILPLPWYMTEGQLHLMGVHSDHAPAKTWGACMGIDTGFAAAHGLRFAPKLGRRGRGLESGDDTSFVAAMKELGAVEHIVEQPAVLHEVNINRRSARYLLRRAFWQGRSEVRRAQTVAGLAKEWNRYRRYARARHAFLIACVYISAVFAGVVAEQFLNVTGRKSSK